MNRRNSFILVAALLLMGGTALAITHMRAHQKLTKPGIITAEIPGSQRLNIFLPEEVLNYKSKILPTDTNVLNGLPHDTSFGSRIYYRDAGSPLLLNVVLMGADRTSIHKPQFCLTGQGWDIDGGASDFDTVRIERPHPYDLQVMKIMNSRDVMNSSGHPEKIRGIYVYWFVADNELTADHWTRMRKMATHLLRTGELQRWAYVSCLALCHPGEEEATYARMKEFIAAAVPQFQLISNPPVAETGASQRASR